MAMGMDTLKIKWFSKKSIDQAQEYTINQRSFGFFDGGCLIFAQAVKLLLPEAKIVTILNHKKPDHYGLLLNNRIWADAGGLHLNKYLWAQKYSIQEHVLGRIDVVDEFVASKEIPKDKELSKYLASILQIKEKSITSNPLSNLPRKTLPTLEDIHI